MISPLSLWCLALVLAQEPTVPTQFAEIMPPVALGQPFSRSPEKTRAVVVIQGFTLHLTPKAESSLKWHSYQKADSPLVKLLSQEADVFAFAYGQTLPVTSDADLPVLRQDIQAIRELGYTEIVLIGFSSGGLIARQFVEDVPDSGVTKVIQVDGPNLGTEWAAGSREAFRHSLTRKAREEFLRERQGKRIPESVQFVSVVRHGPDRRRWDCVDPQPVARRPARARYPGSHPVHDAPAGCPESERGAVDRGTGRGESAPLECDASRGHAEEIAEGDSSVNRGRVAGILLRTFWAATICSEWSCRLSTRPVRWGSGETRAAGQSGVAVRQAAFSTDQLTHSIRRCGIMDHLFPSKWAFGHIEEGRPMTNFKLPKPLFFLGKFEGRFARNRLSPRVDRPVFPGWGTGDVRHE